MSIFEFFKTQHSELLGRVVLVAGVISVLTFWLFVGEAPVATNDFIQYWSAFQVVLQGGNPYDPVALAAIERTLRPGILMPIMMWNPPWLLLLLSPILVLPFVISNWLFLLLSLVGLLFVAEVVASRSLVTGALVSEKRFLYTVLLSFTFLPTLLWYESAQSSIFLLFGVALLFLPRTPENRWSVFLDAFALLLLAIKPNASFLIFPFIVLEYCRNQRVKDLFQLAVWGLSFLLFTELFFPDLIFLWGTSLFQPPTLAIEPSAWEPHSLVAVVPYLFLDVGICDDVASCVTVAGRVGVTLSLALMLAIWPFVRGSRSLWLVWALGLTHVFSPHLFGWDCVMFLPFYLAVSFRLFDEGSRRQGAVMILANALFVLAHVLGVLAYENVAILPLSIALIYTWDAKRRASA